jgi:hypothetical protein
MDPEKAVILLLEVSLFFLKLSHLRVLLHDECGSILQCQIWVLKDLAIYSHAYEIPTYFFSILYILW